LNSAQLVLGLEGVLVKYFVEYENVAGRVSKPEEVEADKAFESGHEGRWLMFDKGGTVVLRVRQEKVSAVRSAEQQSERSTE
jgi:hypothetical protein